MGGEMTSRFSAGSRDKNEKYITPIITQYGVGYWLMPEGVGFDVLIFLQPMKCVEIKNPDQPPSARKLTPKELDRKAACDLLGIEYVVIETPEEMAECMARWIK
jgi:hypothetical protein